MHAGNLGLSQNLESVVGAAGDLLDLPDLVLVFRRRGRQRNPRSGQSRGIGASTNVQFLLAPSRSAISSNTFAAADCFVVSLMAGLSGFIVPSKLYGILAAGRPHVAAMESDSEAKHIAEREGCGLVADPGSPESIAGQIRALYLNRDLTRQMGERAREARAAI